jgi:YfiR/HmsC-like
MMPPDPIRPPHPFWWNPAIGALGSLLCVLLCCPASLRAQSQPTEDDVKAAYLFNFSHFVHYPAGDPAAAKTFDICLIGRNDIGLILQSVVQNENVNGQPVRILQPAHAADARTCAIVYIGSSEASRIEKDLAAMEGSNALTVSDAPHFTDNGGMIQFVLQNSRVRFNVNLSSAEHARLVLSSELLKVALSVSPAPSTETR